MNQSNEELAECDYCGAEEVPVSLLEKDETGNRACPCCIGTCTHTHHDEENK